MSLLSLVAALLLEQWRPLADRRYLYQFLARYATSLESLFNAGETQQGMVAWLVAIVPAVLVAWIVYAMAGLPWCLREKVKSAWDAVLWIRGALAARSKNSAVVPR